MFLPVHDGAEIWFGNRARRRPRGEYPTLAQIHGPDGNLITLATFSLSTGKTASETHPRNKKRAAAVCCSMGQVAERPAA